MTNNTIFDDVFRTMLEKMPSMVVPLINEVFGTAYPDDIPIVQMRNEHIINEEKIITDSHLGIGNKIYHIECQSTSDASMVIRMIEYDFVTALETAEKENGKYRMYFPHSCVLYLRGKIRVNALEMEIVLPDGRMFDYKVPIVQVEQYTKDVIFQKNLLFLLPFYVMRYEKQKFELEENTEKLNSLLSEYHLIERKLEESLLNKGKEREYLELIDLITRISDYIFVDMAKTKKGIGEIMGGKVLELEYDRVLKQGMEQGMKQGMEQGMQQGMEQTARLMLEAGKLSMEEIAGYTGLSIEAVGELKKENRK